MEDHLTSVELQDEVPFPLTKRDIEYIVGRKRADNAIAYRNVTTLGAFFRVTMDLKGYVKNGDFDYERLAADSQLELSFVLDVMTKERLPRNEQNDFADDRYEKLAKVLGLDDHRFIVVINDFQRDLVAQGELDRLRATLRSEGGIESEMARWKRELFRAHPDLADHEEKVEKIFQDMGAALHNALGETSEE